MSDRWSWRAIALAWGCALVALASPALAADPEQVEQLEPGIEVEGIWSEGSARGESVAPTLLYRFSDASDGLGLSVIGQVELAADLEPMGVEASLVLERQTRRWWGQGNVMINTAREDGQSASALGYSWRISRSVGKALWLGVEGLGRAAQLGGVAADDDVRGHFVGPALTIARPLRPGAKVEVSASYLRRIADEGPRQVVQLSVQINL